VVAFPQAKPSAIAPILHALKPVDAVNSAAMRACRTIRPSDFLKLRESRRFVVKVLLCENARHDCLPLILLDHGDGEYVRGDVHTNTIEGFFSILKRGINGVYHHVSR